MARSDAARNAAFQIPVAVRRAVLVGRRRTRSSAWWSCGAPRSSATTGTVARWKQHLHSPW